MKRALGRVLTAVGTFAAAFAAGFAGAASKDAILAAARRVSTPVADKIREIKRGHSDGQQLDGRRSAS